MTMARVISLRTTSKYAGVAALKTYLSLVSISVQLQPEIQLTVAYNSPALEIGRRAEGC